MRTLSEQNHHAPQHKFRVLQRIMNILSFIRIESLTQYWRSQEQKNKSKQMLAEKAHKDNQESQTVTQTVVNQPLQQPGAFYNYNQLEIQSLFIQFVEKLQSISNTAYTSAIAAIEKFAQSEEGKGFNTKPAKHAIKVITSINTLREIAAEVNEKINSHTHSAETATLMPISMQIQDEIENIEKEFQPALVESFNNVQKVYTAEKKKVETNQKSPTPADDNKPQYDETKVNKHLVSYCLTKKYLQSAGTYYRRKNVPVDPRTARIVMNKGPVFLSILKFSEEIYKETNQFQKTCRQKNTSYNCNFFFKQPLFPYTKESEQERVVRVTFS